MLMVRVPDRLPHCHDSAISIFLQGDPAHGSLRISLLDTTWVSLVVCVPGYV